MAAGGDWTLKGEAIVKLAAAIAANDMKMIAEGYMDIAPETITVRIYSMKQAGMRGPSTARSSGLGQQKLRARTSQGNFNSDSIYSDYLR